MIRVYLRDYVVLLALAVLVQSQQDHTGFISIDCGKDTGYTDESTNLYYAPDELYIDTGINVDVSPPYRVPTLQQQLQNVRSFPQGSKNCYTLRPAQGKGANYLVRAIFMYGNYDFLDNPPTFELHLGVDVWDTIKLDNSSHIVMKEMIHSPSTDFLYVCLANIGSGTPFISGLELRQLNDSIYKRESGSLDLLYRYYSHKTSVDSIRYNDDIFDRIWEPMYLINGSQISTQFDVISTLNVFQLPSSVMKAAIIPVNVSEPIHFTYTPTTKESMEFYIYLHLAELSILRANQVREFNITVNDLHLYGPYVPLYLTADTIYNNKALTGSQLDVYIQSTEKSTLPPILNAVEIFSIKKLSQFSTNQLDVDAMRNIKLSYNLTKDWQGDPCVPKAYRWTGINCSYEISSSPRIISLNLSSEELTGDITTSISNLTALQVLNLSNNKLSGNIPEFLTELPSLRILNLSGNSFNGSVPELLLERSRKGLLSLSVESNPALCSSTSCTSRKKKKAFIAPVAACVTLFVLLTAGFLSLLVYTRRKKQKSSIIEAKKPLAIINIQESSYSQGKGGLARFTYSEITNLTRCFRRELGKGGFGVVYYGCLKDGVEVAVKMLSPSINASEQYSTEVELLMSIRHKNLVSLIGYCEEGAHLALIYEYMAKGNLQTVLSAPECLSWKDRLQIAIDSAQGLDYLHNGCRPPIVHRDVKTPNILLNKNLQAKIADFGLSKIFPDENKSYISTRVIGTTGYLDPQYHITQQLNEKSDVYSFGVVLLELITGKTAIMKKDDEQTSLVRWVSPLLERGDIWSIVDKRLQNVHYPNSLWRVTDIALACVKLTAVERPTMSHIVTELKECLEMELNEGNLIIESDNNSIEMGPAITYTAMAPAAR